MPSTTQPSRTIGVLAGAFNPLTCAHLALVEAGLKRVDEVVCVVPLAYPHKAIEGAQIEDRLAMLSAGLRAGRGPYRIQTTQGGLFLEIARELRQSHHGARIEFLCGRDAAERVLSWKYGPGHSLEAMLEEFGLLVAARRGEFVPPPHLAARVRRLPMDRAYDDHSSTEVRRRIAAGEPWQHLVPAAIVDLVGRVYLNPPPRLSDPARRPPGAGQPAPLRKTGSRTGSPRGSDR